MTRLAWGDSPYKNYSRGLDRGVLYAESAAPWNGLVSVNEKYVDGQVESRYFEGVKYLDVAAFAEYSAVLRSYSYPSAFAPCVGEVAVKPGFYVTNQVPAQFGFSYRTQLSAQDHKIHIVYDATATASQREYTTRTREAAPRVFEWNISAVPRTTPGAKPTAHFSIVTSKISSGDLAALEDILYGTTTQEPRLPEVSELIAMLS